MLIEFSASRGRPGSKTYYKDFFQEAEPMKDMGRMLRRYAVSSYMYADGVTDGGEEVQGRKAGETVVAPGNVLFFDFDSKYVPVTFDMLCEKLTNVSAYIAPSRGWSEEIEKYHVAVAVDQPLPMDKEAFKRLYRAVAQRLGLEGLYDPAMESWTQQLAPHFRDDAPEGYVQGEPVSCEGAQSEYNEPEGGATQSSHIAGSVDDDAVFTLSSTQEELSVTEMLAHVRRVGKARVHCVAGLLHDNRADTAFVTVTDDGGVLYHCAGGRCGHTLIVPENPFAAEAEVTEVETREETLRDVIEASSVFGEAVVDPKATKNVKEAAVSYALGVRAERHKMSLVDGEVRRYNGVYWEEAFAGKTAGHNFIRDAIVESGFPVLAHENAFTTAVHAFFMKNMSLQTLEVAGDYLNLRNGVLRIDRDGVKMLPHSPDYLFTSVLDYDYAPGAKCPTWETVVQRVMCGDAETVLAFQEAMGYLMLRRSNFEKMIAFVGEGENGKSTVLKVLKMLVGRSGYSAQPIKVLVKDSSEGQYARAALAGKLINLTNELTPSSLEADAFKDLISGEDITARAIYGAPFVLATVPKQVVAMNSTDGLVKERTHGFERRLHLIPFNYRLREEHKDERLFEKLEVERSGILNWVLAGARRVSENGRLATSPAMATLFESVKRDADPVQQFVEECLEITDVEALGYSDLTDGVLSSAAVLAAYQEFCAANGYRFPLGRNKLLTRLLSLGVPQVDTVRRAPGRPARRARGWGARISSEDGVFSVSDPE
jgi:P4 family phage/plasmid primase-like protien